MSTPTVTGIIPAHNAERFLRSALDSVFAQTYPLSEVIVVNDGSTDGTSAVTREYGNRVKLVEQPHQAGDVAARDAGLAVARGEYVAFLDADDLWVPHKTARQLDVLRTRPDVDLCVGHYQNFWDTDVAEEEAHYRDLPFSQPTAGYILPTLLAARTVFDRFGRFGAAGMASNTGWFARAVSMGARIETLPDVLLHRRLHRHNISRVQSYSVERLFHLIKARRRRPT